MPSNDIQRGVLPIPDRKPVCLTTYDAKDPVTKFPPITPLRPPEAAPNVLLILLDDVGFGAASVFGGPCQTPNAEKLPGNSELWEALRARPSVRLGYSIVGVIDHMSRCFTIRESQGYGGKFIRRSRSWKCGSERRLSSMGSVLRNMSQDARSRYAVSHQASASSFLPRLA
jgi:hypothetical protein